MVVIVFSFLSQDRRYNASDDCICMTYICLYFLSYQFREKEITQMIVIPILLAFRDNCINEIAPLNLCSAVSLSVFSVSETGVVIFAASIPPATCHQQSTKSYDPLFLLILIFLKHCLLIPTLYFRSNNRIISIIVLFLLHIDLIQYSTKQLTSHSSLIDLSLSMHLFCLLLHSE